MIRFSTTSFEGGTSAQSVAPATFSLSASGVTASPANPQTVTATVTNQTNANITGVVGSLEAPNGWTATSTSAFTATISPGQTVTAQWTVKPMASTTIGYVGQLTGQVSFTSSGQSETLQDSLRLAAGDSVPIVAATASSTQSGYPASNAIDGNPTTYWAAEWSPYQALPQSITLDLGQPTNVAGVAYLPRQDGAEQGIISSYVLYGSTDGTTYTQIASGSWSLDDTGLQDIPVGTTARYLKLVATAGVGGFATAAEITVLAQATETTLSQANMTATATSSQSGYPASNALDGNSSTLWAAEWSPYQALPQSITVNLGGSFTINQLEYLPRQDGYNNGNILGYTISTSTNGTTWTTQGSGTWADNASLKTATFPSTTASYIQLTVTSGDGGWATAAEINVGGAG
jgi:hypothetical protein